MVRRHEPLVVAAWLIEHAKEMSEDMFDAGHAYLVQLDQEHLIALRAFTPSGVFTPAAKKVFLQYTSRPDLVETADLIFTDDVEFASRLPAEVKGQVVMMMKVAYEKGIRPTDRRI